MRKIAMYIPPLIVSLVCYIWLFPGEYALKAIFSTIAGFTVLLVIKLIVERDLKSESIITIIFVLITTAFFFVTMKNNAISEASNELLDKSIEVAEKSNNLQERELLFHSKPSLYIRQTDDANEANDEKLEIEILNLGPSYALLPQITFEFAHIENDSLLIHKGSHSAIAAPDRIEPWGKHPVRLANEFITIAVYDFEKTITDPDYLENPQKYETFFIMYVSVRRVNDFKEYHYAYIDQIHFNIEKKRATLKKGLSIMPLAYKVGPNIMKVAEYLIHDRNLNNIYVKGAPLIIED